MAFHSCQFTYKYDLFLIVPTVLYSVIVMILTTFWNLHIPHFKVAVYVVFCLPIFANVVFTVLALVPLCGRACGYNLCVKTAATKKKHRKALREILPFFLLVALPIFVSIMRIFRVYGDILLDSLGLLFTIMFAIHLCFVRKGLRKLRGSSKAQETDSLDSCHNKQRHVHAETVYISGEGMSETCNTRCSLVNESVEDTRYPLNKTNQVLH